jgi:hypothetical protein
MSSYVDALSISQRAGDAEHGGVADPRDAAWIVRVGNAAGGMEHVLKIGCQQPAWLDVALVDDLEQGSLLRAELATPVKIWVSRSRLRAASEIRM